jgi:hypothetical protein
MCSTVKSLNIRTWQYVHTELLAKTYIRKRHTKTDIDTNIFAKNVYLCQKNTLEINKLMEQTRSTIAKGNLKGKFAEKNQMQ